MALKFFNVRTKETRVAVTEPMIAAMYNSSDLTPNAHQGQDMGWRLAPEVVIEMREIRSDEMKLDHIATRLKKAVEEVSETDILLYISAKTSAANAPVLSDADFSKEYLAEIAELEAKREASRIPIEKMDEYEQAQGTVLAPDTTVTTTESLADLEKRVELEERLARARATTGDTTTTTTAPPATTTTTTEARPSTTTTTTKAK